MGKCIIFVLFLSVCATGAHTKKSTLEKKLEAQSQVILNLRQEIARLKRVSPHPTLKAEKLLVKKLIPEEDGDLLEKEDLDKILGSDDLSIADSSHEMMHYYYEAQKNLESAQYEDALKNLKKFIDENPTHVYADRAQFLVFESYFRAKEFGLAVLAATTLETRYPYSFRLDETLFKKAMAFKEMNQRDHARVTLEKVIKRNPNGIYAQNAGKELSLLVREDLTQRNKTQATVAPPLLDDAQ